MEVKSKFQHFIKRKKRLIISIIIISIIAIIVAMFYNGILLFNNPSAKKYPIQGVDVSAYQGDIDWKKLAGQDIDFAFIKATEGSNFVDEKFQDNYKDAIDAGIRVGAYHFFSYDSSGEVQGENFISVVDKTDNMLPPVIDIEFYGDKARNLPDVEKTKKELGILLSKLEEHYGMKPIIYATKKSYDLYIANDYCDYDIWIRDVLTKPKLSDNRTWTFWQYTSRKKLEGYIGEEKYIDVNVFYGSEKEFAKYAKENK